MKTNRKFIESELIGKKFGMLTVIKEGERLTLPSGQYNRTMFCRCDCGITKHIRLVHLSNGKTLSCGCANIVCPKGSSLVIYRRWRAIIYRCHVSKRTDTYQENGITVCEEWRNSFPAFEKWAKENGFRRELQIDRENNKKGYSPDNCRFVPNIVNVNNREITFLVEYNGEILPFMDIVREKDLFFHMAAIHGRIKRGWSDQRAIDTPIRQGNYARVNMTPEDSKIAYEKGCLSKPRVSGSATDGNGTGLN